MNQRFHVLFLLVLVVAALAALAGVRLFAQASAQNRRDAIVQRSVELAVGAQQWAARPSAFGGGGGAFDGVDVWRVTGQSGSGTWLEDRHTLYRVAPHPRPGYAHVTALDKALGLRVVVVLDRERVLETAIEPVAEAPVATARASRVP